MVYFKEIVKIIGGISIFFLTCWFAGVMIGKSIGHSQIDWLSAWGLGYISILVLFAIFAWFFYIIGRIWRCFAKILKIILE